MNARTIRVLVVDDEPAARSAISEMLEDEDYAVRSAANGERALEQAEDWEPDVLITDVKMPTLGGIELMERLRTRFPDMAVVIMTAFGSVEGAVKAMHLGADDYLSKPVHFPQLLVVLRRVLQHRALQREARSLREALREQDGGEDGEQRTVVIGQSKAFRELLELVGQVADSPVPVLLLGETGSGKQFLGRLLHEWSPRKRAKFVVIKCGALDGPAFERELFGVEENGEVLSEGRLGEAAGGTLLLDDVTELPPRVQERLLTLLQDRVYTRVGGQEPRTSEVRIVTATNKDFDRAMREGVVREELAYRLNVVTLRTPPLRERREDVPLLAMHFLRRFSAQAGKSLLGFSDRSLGVLLDCDWPGNIRQLEHTVERAVVMCRGSEVEPRDLPPELASRAGGSDEPPEIPGSTLRELERYAILRTLEHVGGSTSKAAKMLGISPRKIQYRLNEYRSTRQSGVPVVVQGPRK
ncbi:MAG: sigma-54-dependent Fis family transcriptional regulator [Myxococcales bacterium]|nr:sigma-54-dependent Fis family transcriptional regulator [Myxococcales bacterium]MCB9756064.1 sigma-54-dependent Fis family transcriptional regulator [Myxococcales bacterium]